MRVKITIGDWSEDGHNQYEQFVFESNKSLEEIQQAYKNSCKLTGIRFNSNGSKQEDYTELYLPWDHPEADDRCIAVEYESDTISELAHDQLGKHGIDTNNYADEDAKLGVESFLRLLIDFIKLSLPDLMLEEASFKKSELKEISAVNGWWNDGLNVQFGYGLYQ